MHLGLHRVRKWGSRHQRWCKLASAVQLVPSCNMVVEVLEYSFVEQTTAGTAQDTATAGSSPRAVHTPKDTHILAAGFEGIAQVEHTTKAEHTSAVEHFEDC